MSLIMLSDFLLWCTVINYGILLMWFLVYAAGRTWLVNLHGRWFHLAATQFDAVNYAGMAVYKIGILLLNLVPYIAVRILISHAS